MVLLLVSLLTALIVGATGVVGAKLIRRGFDKIFPPLPVWRYLVHGAAVGALVFCAGHLLTSTVWAGGIALFAILLGFYKNGREVIVWRRFFGGLDAACRAADESAIAGHLDLGGSPIDPRKYQRWATQIVFAARYAHDLGQSDRALGWLGVVDVGRVPHALVLPIWQMRAALGVACGRRDVARAAVAQVPIQLVQPSLQEAFNILRRLLAVLDGDASDALLAEVELSRAASRGASVDGWIAIEAHLHAARGNEDRAREILHDLGTRAAARGDANVLARIVRHAGPASAIAAEIERGATPYR